ncbi:MAG: hypothetical protein ACLUSP_08615 [Christensenellales bacterium]
MKKPYTTNPSPLARRGSCREIPYGRNENNRTRLTPNPHPPGFSPAQALRPAVAHRR